jgi:hypothetical protein
MLEDLAYQVTSARSAGVENPEALRSAVKKMRQLVNDAESLAVTLEAQRRKSEEL